MINRIILITLAILLIGFFWFYYQINLFKDSFCDEGSVFTISRGENFIEIGNNLKEEGIIDNPLYFNTYVLVSGKFNRLQAGTYLLCPDDSIKNISEILARGETAQDRITIVEGWNMRDIGNYFEKIGIIDEENFIERIKSNNFNDLFSFLEEKPEGATLEGYLFPDTYFIPYDSDIDSIIKLMLYNFNDKLTDDLREEIRNQEKTIFEIITVASLIEKEVRSYEDKRLVSGIIWKRLEIGMPLQIDATISYITGRRTTRISITETQIDSPYNTYKYKGLPVGPISNPGIESIKAAIFPEKSDYLFYLSKPDSGETVFSKNHDEHVAAKNKYLR